MKFTTKIIAIYGIVSALSSTSYAAGSSQVVVMSNISGGNPYSYAGATYSAPVFSPAFQVAAFPAAGIRIINANPYTVKAIVLPTFFGHCVDLPFIDDAAADLSGAAAQGGEAIYDFTHTTSTNPKHICVHVYGKTSILGVGGWTPVTNNNRCVIQVVNAGLFQGVNLRYSPECNAGNANAVAGTSGLGTAGKPDSTTPGWRILS